MAPLPVHIFAAQQERLISLLRSMVELESPTTEKQAVDRLGAFVVDEAQRIGAEIRRYPQTAAGDHWSCTWGAGEKSLLLLTHLDTVYPLRTLEKMPLREQGGRLYGPGVLDMKVGIAMALCAIEVLQQQKKMEDRRLTLLCTSDEETGSSTSRALIEELAHENLLALCLEPALADGSLKTWRKGTGLIRIETLGRSAHAGSEPELGVNAILEMTYQVQKVVALADADAGTTINVGRIHGGTRTNVIPEQCKSAIDIRIRTLDEQRRITQALKEMEPMLDDAQVLIKCEWNRPPMVRNRLMQETFSRARSIAAELGLQLLEGGTGGGSDANFVAALGVAVLDGLGAIGEAAHSPNENVQLGSLPERTALLAALISDW